MKFRWEYQYVNDGELEPDKHGRWAISCYIYVHIDKALPSYNWCKDLYGGRQHMPSFIDAGNIGLSNNRFFY